MKKSHSSPPADAKASRSPSPLTKAVQLGGRKVGRLSGAVEARTLRMLQKRISERKANGWTLDGEPLEVTRFSQRGHGRLLYCQDMFLKAFARAG